MSLIMHLAHSKGSIHIEWRNKWVENELLKKNTEAVCFNLLLWLIPGTIMLDKLVNDLRVPHSFFLYFQWREYLLYPLCRTSVKNKWTNKSKRAAFLRSRHALKKSQALSYLILTVPRKGVAVFIIPRKMRHQKVKRLAQMCLAYNWEEHSSLATESLLLTISACITFH